MPVSFNYQTPTINTAGFVDDPNPNVTPPAPDRIMDVRGKREDGTRAEGVRFFLEMTTPSVASRIDVGVWVRDKRSGRWARAAFFNNVRGDLREVLLAVGGVAPGEVFFRFTDLMAGTATNFKLYAEPE